MAHMLVPWRSCCEWPCAAHLRCAYIAAGGFSLIGVADLFLVRHSGELSRTRSGPRSDANPRGREESQAKSLRMFANSDYRMCLRVPFGA